MKDSIAAAIASLVLLSGVSAHAQSIRITPNGSTPSAIGAPANFSGHVVVDPLFPATDETRATTCQTACKVAPRSASNFDPLSMLRGEEAARRSWSGLRSRAGSGSVVCGELRACS